MDKEPLPSYEEETILDSIVKDIETKFINNGYINRKMIYEVLYSYHGLEFKIPKLNKWIKEEITRQLKLIKQLSKYDVKRITYTFNVTEHYVKKRFKEIKKDS